MELDDNSVVMKDVGRYTLSYYPSGTDKIVVVFASAGARLAGPIDEFKSSLRNMMFLCCLSETGKHRGTKNQRLFLCLRKLLI